MNKKTVLLVKPLEPSQEAFKKLGFAFKEYLPVKKCVNFMEQNYPDWRNPLAYWD